jgi:4-hydroxybutyrate CoA-transferase
MHPEKSRRYAGWREEYRGKLVSPDVAARVVKSGDRVVLPCAFVGVTPQAIVQRRDELEDVALHFTSLLYDPGWFATDMSDTFELVCEKYLNPIARPSHDERRLDFLPFSNLTWWKTHRDERPDRRGIDVFVTQLSPPDENGFCSFGSEVWERKRYAEVAKTVIGEVSDVHVRTHGDNFIHVSEVDYFVDVGGASSPTGEDLEAIINAFPEERREEVRRRSAGFNPVLVKGLASLIGQFPVEEVERAFNIEPPDEASKGIAENLKTLLRDRDTIQVGVGRPSKYMVELGVFDHVADLGIYSEMGCPGLGNLVRRGIATGKYATLHPGVAVLTGLNAMRWDEIQFASRNPMFALYGSEYILDISNIAANHNMVSINNGLQVDLTGQITCETQFGPRLINGPGGQIEFHIGAFLSRGGRAVTLLPSTALRGAVSTIVPQLDEGSIVDIPRVYADFVVTEHGVARLAGRTNRERADALIEVAHPDFRADLRGAARELLYP